MKRTITIALATASLLAFGATTADAAHGVGDATIGLSGGREVGTKGDPNGSGKIELDFFSAVQNPDVAFPGQPYVCYEITTRNVDDLVGLHIHEASGTEKNSRRDNGPVVVDLLADTNAEGDATCVAIEPAIFDGILDEPSEYYVNAHTAAFPAGAIRGQLNNIN